MPVTLSSTQSNGLATSWYKVDNFGFASIRVTELAPAYFHTFSNTQIAATPFFPDLQNVQPGDFNGDGNTDIALTWSFFPHFFIRPNDILARTLLFFNDGTGRLAGDSNLFTPTASLGGTIYETSTVADFNGDGRDDVMSASGGLNNIVTGVYSGQPIPLVLSGPGGVFQDASANIEGQQTSGALPAGFLFAHDISSGDFDNDRDIDVLTNKTLLLNDGSGRFSVASSQLPASIRQISSLLLSSTAADFDGDGTTDFALFGGAPNSPTTSAGGYAVLSKGSASIESRLVVSLPFGPFGPGATVTRDSATGDIDQDGDIDIVALSSRDSPHHNIGLAIQLLLNNGLGGFSDGTSGRIDNSRLGDLSPTGTATSTSGYGGSDVVLADWNGDGHLDILISSGKGPTHGTTPLLNIFQNDGSGRFARVDLTMLPFVSTRNLAGHEQKSSTFPIRQTIPVDLNGDRMLDFISVVETPVQNYQTDPSELTAYTILSKSVFGTGPNGADGADAGAPGFNEQYYLATNVAAANAVASGTFQTGLAHYLATGKAAGLQAFAPGTHVWGSAGNDVIVLREGHEEAWGGAGNDHISGGAGNDRIDGGAGTDTAKINGNRSAYVVTTQNGTLRVQGPEGVDTLSTVERVVFSDKGIAWDMTGNAGAVARLLGALLGPAGVTNQEYLGIGLKLLDDGLDYQTLMANALAVVLGATPSPSAVVTLLYTNVAKTTPSPEELASYTEMLRSGATTPAGLAVAAAQTDLNASNIGLTGLALTGLEYLL